MAFKQVEHTVRCKTCGEKIRVPAAEGDHELRVYCPVCRSLHFYREEEIQPIEA
jgi:phage FluMu protein Com